MAADADGIGETAAGTADPSEPAGRRLLERVVEDRLAMIGLVIVAMFAATAIAAPWLAPHDPAAVHLGDRLAGPSLRFPLGTDPAGRDLLSRLLVGARWSLGAAALATLLIVTLGVVTGTVAGYYGGRLDQLIMRMVDLLLGFPSLLLALAIAGALGPGIRNVLLGLVAVWWVDYARIVRGLVLTVRERDFVEAARALGASGRQVIVRHILPSVVPPVVVLATLEMGSLILALAGLNFLGLGVQPPSPEWGAMVNEGRRYLTGAPQLIVYPGLAITMVVMGFNLLGDGLRDALDPRL
ncbi:MAG: ABC transporter permease subunit [Actinomycetota bacterium]|nr:ABC transporter permease subunit [Actinomycetota bacterium]